MEWIVIASAPSAEEVPMTPPDKDSPAREIAEVFARQLVRHFGTPPKGTSIVVERIRDDVSTVYCVVCYYEPSDATSTEYAWRCSNAAPRHWDKVARQELTTRGILSC